MIATHSTISLRISKDIYKRLPSFCNGSYEYDEFSPFSEPDTIISEPSSRDLLYRIDITENLSNITLFPSKVLEYLCWETFVFFDAFEILTDTIDKWS